MALTTEEIIARQGYINASEVANVLSIYLPEKYGHFYSYSSFKGEIPFETKYCLLHQKLLTTEQVEVWSFITKTKAMDAGNTNEPIFIERFCKDNAYNLLQTQPRLIKENLGASLDAIIQDPITDEKFALEVKYTKATDINDEKFTQKIDRYKLQVQLQLYCSGLKKGFLYISNKRLINETYEIFYDESIVEDIKTATAMFFADLEKLKEDNLYIEPDFSVERDTKMHGLIEYNYSPKITTIEDAIKLYHCFKIHADLFEKAKDFLKDNLVNDIEFGGKTYYVAKTQESIYETEEEVENKKQELAKKFENDVAKIAVGNIKASARSQVKVKKV